MKPIRYKGISVNKPDNISLKFIKKVVDNLGRDHSFTVDQLIDFLSTNKITYHEQRNSL